MVRPTGMLPPAGMAPRMLVLVLLLVTDSCHVLLWRRTMRESSAALDPLGALRFFLLIPLHSC